MFTLGAICVILTAMFSKHLFSTCQASCLTICQSSLLSLPCLIHAGSPFFSHTGGELDGYNGFPGFPLIPLDVLLTTFGT